MNLINEFMNPNSVLRQGQVLSHALGMKASGTEIQRLIDPMILQKMCVASYALNKGQTPEADIDGWRLVGSTPTVLCYLKHGVSVVAVRGTASMDDWQTNTTIPLNQLADTKRAQTMIKEVEKWKHSRPNETQWFATGHSLGGALCDVLLREKLVREAFTFNPAVQPQDFNGKLPNRRVYARGDPLYQLMGQFTVGAVLLPAKDFLTELRYRVLGENVQDYLNQHDLSSFTDAPQSALVGNAKKQPKKPKQPKPRLPIQRGPNLQLMQDLFARLQAQREPDREMDDLTREMDQIIPKDKTPAPPPPSPPSGDGRRRGGMRRQVPIRGLTWGEIATLIATSVAGTSGIMGSVLATIRDPRAADFLWAFTASTLAALFGGTISYWREERRRALELILNPPDELPVEPENEFEIEINNPLAGLDPLPPIILADGTRAPRPRPQRPIPSMLIPPENPPEQRFDEGLETGLMSDVPINSIVGILNGDEVSGRVYLAPEILSMYEASLQPGGTPFRNPFTRGAITSIRWVRATLVPSVQEVTIPMAEGSARPATFQYSRDDLTTKQKAAERAAYYRKHPAEKPKRTKAKEVEVEPVEPVKPVKFDEPTKLADRARLTRAKQTLRKGIVRRLFRKSAEIRLWIALYTKGAYFPETELKTKEREAYDIGRGLFTKSEWEEIRKQTTNIENGKWQEYIPKNVHDRISKQVADVKERLQKKVDLEMEEGPSPDRKKRAPKKEGVEIWKTPNGYEWYVEDGKVFDLDGSRVGYTGMAVFKNITKK